MSGLSWYATVDTGNRYLPNAIPASPQDMTLIQDLRVRMAPRSVGVCG